MHHTLERTAGAGIAAAVVAAALALAHPAAADDARPANPDHVIHYGDKVMGTIVNVTIWGDDEEKAAKAAAAVFDEFRRIDRVMSSWREDSAIARVNEAAGERAVRVDPEVLALVVRAQAVARATGGAFDITVGAFRGLWKFGEDRDGSIPSGDEVAAHTARVGYERVKVERGARTVKLADAGMRVTLGGIAKGYAVDRAVEILRERGILDFILQAGGDLYASGVRGSRAWRVGIRDPRGPRNATFAIAEIEDRTFSTSGDYERGFVKDGVRYHHILDPDTGRPARKARSVTVLAPDAVTADVWSTSLFVLGPKRGLKIVESRDDLEAVFVDADNEVQVSSGLEDELVILREPTPGP